MSPSWTVCLLLITALASTGCLGKNKIVKRTVQDLYQEALQSAEKRPEAVRPAVPESGVEQFDLAGNRDSSLSCDGIPSEMVEPAAPFESSVPVGSSLSTSVKKKSEVVRASFRNTGRIVVASAPGELQDPLADSDTMDDMRITESFDQTDIREALNIIAAQAKKSVVIDDTIGGVVSAEILNQDFDAALESLLQPLALYYAIDGERYIIAPADPDSPLYSYIAKRSLYAPKFQDIASLTTMLPTRYKKYFQVSPERNLIVIDAPNRIAEEIEVRLLELDKPIPQVELEAIVCVVAPDSSFRFGLDWGHRVAGAESDDFNVSMNNLGLKSAVSAEGARNIFSDFAVTSAFVRLLAQEGYITIRAAPRVTAKDGEKANISINRETFFSLQPNNSSVFFQQNIQKVEAGISLEITPRVHDDMVSVKIGKAEVSEDIRTQATNAELSSVVYPIINRRTVSTEVMVRDGHTIVIGGLVQRQTVDRIAKVPFFSSIPVAGKLFESIEKQEQDAEVAIFICPRIVPVSTLCPECTP